MTDDRTRCKQCYIHKSRLGWKKLVKKNKVVLIFVARREAIMRMKEDARAGGYHAISNMRLETSRIASSSGNNKGTAAVEILAFGTGLKLARRAPAAP